MPLQTLPVEILLLIQDFLDAERYINALVRTARRFHTLFNDYLYHHHIEHHSIRTFELAAKDGNEGTVRNFLRAVPTLFGNSVTQPGFRCSNALFYALQHGRKAVVALFIEHEDDIEDAERRFHTLTPLQLAVEEDHVSIAKLLIAHGADLHKQYNRCTCLHMASYLGYAEMVQLLLESGADVNALDKNLQTPLHYAANTIFCAHSWIRKSKRGKFAGKARTVVYLLDHHADPEALDKFGKRPQDLTMPCPDRDQQLYLDKGLIKNLNWLFNNWVEESHGLDMESRLYEAPSRKVLSQVTCHFFTSCLIYH